MNNTLFNKLSLFENFNKIIPSTTAGEMLHKKYVGIFESEDNRSISNFHNFLIECNGINDTILNTFSKTLSEAITIKAPTSWKVNIILEQLKYSKVDVNNSVAEKLNYLRFINESDLKNVISEGCLGSYANIIPAFRNIINEVCGEKNSIKLIEGDIMYTPISYVEIKNGSKYFMFENVMYVDNGIDVKQSAEAPSANFITCNNALDNIPYNPECDDFELDFLPGAVNVTMDGKIFKDKYPYTIEELKDVLDEMVFNNENITSEQKINEGKKFDSLKILLENFANYVKMDNATAVMNKTTNKTTILFEGNKNYVLNNNGIVSTSKTLSESLSIFTKMSGVNIKSLFESKIKNEQQALLENATIVANISEHEKELVDIINNCNEHLKFCNIGSTKYNEFIHIKEDAISQLNILKLTRKDMVQL